MIQQGIKREGDHNFALSLTEQLMDAEPGTPECDGFALMSTLVKFHECEHFPIALPDPATAIKFRMERLGLK